MENVWDDFRMDDEDFEGDEDSDDDWEDEESDDDSY